MQQRPFTIAFLTFVFVVSPAGMAQELTDSGTLAEPPGEVPVPGNVRFEMIPSATGVDIIQDSQGFMWFGGIGTLHRFDGYTLKSYAHDPTDSTTISSDWIESFYLDSNGHLWVGTLDINGTGGLNRYDEETDTFVRYEHDELDPTSISNGNVFAIMEDQYGLLWIGTKNGLNSYDRQTDTFTRYTNTPDDPTSLSDNTVRVVYEDQDGTLWIGTQFGGLNRFNRTTNTFKAYRYNQDDEQSLISNWVHALLEDSHGTLWVGTWGDGLHTMDREQETFTRFGFEPDNPLKLSRPHLTGQTPSYDGCDIWDCGGVSFIHESLSGEIWIGSLMGGLNRYDPKTETLKHYEASAGAPNSMVDNLPWSIYETPEGAIWLGSWFNVYKVHPAEGKFSHFFNDPIESNGLSSNLVNGLFEDSEGKIWIGTQHSGLDRFDRSTGLFTNYRYDANDPTSISTDHVRSVYEDEDGTLWIGTMLGLNKFDRTTGVFTQFTRDRTDSTSISSTVIYGATQDQQGNIWTAGLRGGPSKLLDAENGIFRDYDIDYDASGTINDILTHCIYRDRNGDIWIGSRGGIHLYDEERDAFTMFPTSAWVTSIYEDDLGRFWVGTWGAGLLQFDRNTGKSQRYATQEGLPLDKVSAIIEDHDHRLWVSTARGSIYSPNGGLITRLDPETMTFTTFGPANGLPNIGFRFGTAVACRDGTLVFGGSGGFISFRPEDFGESAEISPPRMALTDLRVFNELVAPGPETPLPRSLNLVQEIELPHSSHDITLDYVALAYQQADEVRYQYILENHDADWVEARTQRSARYSNLAPGDYVFRVRAMRGQSFWSEEDAVLRIAILPPWWQTRWAYFLYLCMPVGAAVTAYRIQHARILHKERERARVKEADLRAEAAELQAKASEAQVAASEMEARALKAENRRKEVELEKAHDLETAYQHLEEQKQTLEEQAHKLRELDKMKTRFFANISHEFRTPLTLILGPLKDALGGTLETNGDRLRHQMSMMYRNGRRLLHLINQLLDLSKLESGNMTLRARTTDVVPFVSTLVSLFKSQAERREVSLQFATSVDQLELYFEPDKMEKVISNLVSNALKFTPSHGKVRVSVTRSSHSTGVWAEITVMDTGEGIPEEELPHIFDRFHQVDTSSVREHEGSGIGLALVKELVELHGGEIHAESELGFGTTFVVRLREGKDHLNPEDIVLETSADSKEKAMDAGLLETDGLGRLIRLPDQEEQQPHPDAPVVLVVEDNADMREYLRSHLTPRYRVAEAVDGVEGLEMAGEVNPALIISDVMMPRMDGHGLCEAIKTDKALNHIPVVLLTARATEESKIQGLQTGADDYIYKPFSAEELLMRVENLIELRRLLKQRFSREVVVGPSEITVSSADAAFLNNVREIVEQHMADSNFTSDWLADEVGLSRRHLRRKIQALTNLSLSGYIRMMRLERAAQLLGQRAGTVSEIAYQVGFKNTAHFSRLFNHVFGVSPSRYADERWEEQIQPD